MRCPDRLPWVMPGITMAELAVGMRRFAEAVGPVRATPYHVQRELQKRAKRMAVLRHIAATIVCLLIVALFSLTCPGCVFDKAQAGEEEAHAWAKKLGADDVSRIVCNGTDSDGDGYVSCTLVYKTGGREQVECAWGAFPWNSGCREPKVAPAQINTHTHTEQRPGSERGQ